MFIVFEGIDGAGSTTQSKLLYEFLVSKGFNVLLTKEPTNSEIGKLIRKALKKEIELSNLTLQLLFIADRANHLEKEILPALKSGKIVVCDRYFLSTIAYGMLDLDRDWLINLNSKFLFPHIIFLLDVDPKIAIKRISSSKSEKELFEKEEILKKVRENYLQLAKEFKNVYIIDASKSIEEVFESVKEIVSKFLKI